jgi:hypothetical protein
VSPPSANRRSEGPPLDAFHPMHGAPRVKQERHTSQKEIHALLKHTSAARSAQRSLAIGSRQPFLRLSPATVLLFILCVSLVAMSVALVALWLPALTHLAPSVAVIPHPWGCGGSSTAC